MILTFHNNFLVISLLYSVCKLDTTGNMNYIPSPLHPQWHYAFRPCVPQPGQEDLRNEMEACQVEASEATVADQSAIKDQM